MIKVLQRKSEKLRGKRIALCVTGSVAAIQSPRLARELKRHGADVTAYMSRAAQDIIHPNALEFATGNEVVTRLTGGIEHLEKWDLVVVAPATANTIAKMACGMGDTPVTALLLSAKKVLVAPAMNLEMYENPMVKRNIEELKSLGHSFVPPVIEEGEAKMAPIEEIVDNAISLLHSKEFSGLRFLITAGATQESIDPVRIITNNSSGKMGLSLAREAFFRGADVTLILGRSIVIPPRYLKVVRAETGKAMLDAVVRNISNADVFISAAAVSDFTVEKSPYKLDSRKDYNLTLVPAPKVLESVKDAKCVKVGFKALHGSSERELVSAASQSLRDSNLNLVVANDLSTGVMGSDEAEVFLVGDKKVQKISRRSKLEVAEKILDAVQECIPSDAG